MDLGTMMFFAQACQSLRFSHGCAFGPVNSSSELLRFFLLFKP